MGDVASCVCRPPVCGMVAAMRDDDTKTYVGRVLTGIGLLLFLPMGACDRAELEERLSSVEERLRPGDERRGKVGSLRGWEVVHRAHGIAEAIHQRPEPACVRTVPQGYVLEIELELSRLRQDEVVQAWSEKRRYLRDEAGIEEVAFEAVFTTEVGQSGRRQGRSVATPEAVFVEEAPQRYSMRPWTGGDLYALGPDMIDDLLVVFTGGWRPVESLDEGQLARWQGLQTGGTALRCGVRPSERPSRWRDRFVPRGTLLEASLRVEADEEWDKQRVLLANWQVAGQEVLQLRYRDRLREHGGALVEVPQGSHRVAGLDRSASALDEAMTQWIARQWVEATRWPLEEIEEP
jgi:hypothetical protein